MIEQQETDSEQPKSNCSITEPLAPVQVEDSAAGAEDEHGKADSPTPDSSTKGKKALELLGRLTVNEWLTLIVGLGSLAVSFLAWRTASDSTDIKSAIGNLSTLADQTKRQADALTGQLGAVKDQVAALRAQTEEAKQQTAAIANQTEAIKASSEAAIRSATATTQAAQAQKLMADTTAEAHRPDPDLFDLEIAGLKNPPDGSGTIPATLTWKIRNVGGSAFTVKDVYWGILGGSALPDVMPVNGGHTPGVGIVVASNNPTSVFSINNIPFRAEKEHAYAVAADSDNLFFYAVLTYHDTSGAEHHKCFGRKFILKDGNSSLAEPAGGSAYRCAD